MRFWDIFTDFPNPSPSRAVIFDGDYHPIDREYEKEGLEDGWLEFVSWYRDEDNVFVAVYHVV
jgi:hypothetical protein